VREECVSAWPYHCWTINIAAAPRSFVWKVAAQCCKKKLGEPILQKQKGELFNTQRDFSLPSPTPPFHPPVPFVCFSVGMKATISIHSSKGYYYYYYYFIFHSLNCDL
jgi:hypothetical protein